jgi:hypothetical protein
MLVVTPIQPQQQSGTCFTRIDMALNPALKMLAASRVCWMPMDWNFFKLSIPTTG